MIIRILFSCITLAMCLKPLFAQLPEKWTDYDEIWLPEKVIEDIQAKHTAANYSKFGGPIQAIAFLDETLYVYSLHSLMTKPKIRKRGKKKKLINPLILNMTIYYEGQFDDTRFFLSYEKPDRMLLEMNYKRGTRIDSLYYIKNLGPYAFEEPYMTYYSVLLSGDYHTSVDGVARDVSFGLDGQIKGHPNWVGYKMKKARYIPPEEVHTLYFLVDFTLKDTDVPLELAFLYDDEAKVWEGYEYKITPPRSFSRSEKPIVRLEKKAFNSDEIATTH